jgi:5-hydroxyisourate hydrolase-like protein (transthyretin family)
MKLSTKQTGHLAMQAVAIMFSLNMNAGKYLLSNFISPFGYTMARVGFAAIAFRITSYFRTTGGRLVTSAGRVIVLLSGVCD